MNRTFWRGAFTKAYLLEDGKTVELHSVDPVKECMSLGWFPSHRLFPKIKRGDTDNGRGEAVYTMEYFPKVTSLKGSLIKSDWELYKELKLKLSYLIYPYNKWEQPDTLRAAINTINGKYWVVKQALYDAVNGLCNYGCEIRFEISPRNVAVKNKRLILLDCFFMADALRRVRT